MYAFVNDSVILCMKIEITLNFCIRLKAKEHLFLTPYNSLSNFTELYAMSPPDHSSPPPTYQEAVDPNAPPPTYESLFGRMRRAHKNRKGVCDFIKNLLLILLGTLGCTIIIGLTTAIPISMIVIGSIYVNDCPQGEQIPVYLIVGGVFGVLKQLLHFGDRIRYAQLVEAGREDNFRQSPIQVLINCFIMGWFIIGSVWVYKEYEPNYDPTVSKIYCNKTLYLFAFWLITIMYCILGTFMICLCCVTVITLALPGEPAPQSR